MDRVRDQATQGRAEQLGKREGQERATLRRMVEAGQMSGGAAEPVPEKSIPLAIARAAKEKLGLPLEVRALNESRLSLAELPEVIEDMSLILLIEGPGEALGLVAVPGATLSAFIEMMTTGRLGRTVPAPRRPTRMDAAMTVEVVDAMLANIEEELAETEAAIWAGGFRYASCVEDARPIGMLLEDQPFRVWKMDMTFGMHGERHGGLVWAVPAQGRGERRRRRVAFDAAGKKALETEQDNWHAQMEQTVMASGATLDAVLYRVSLPLSVVMQLAPGMELPLPSDALGNLTIEAAGRVLSPARLGQHSGMRAVRLIDHEQPGDQDGLGIAPSPLPARGAITPRATVAKPVTAAEPQAASAPAAGQGTPPGKTDPDGPAGDIARAVRSAAG